MRPPDAVQFPSAVATWLMDVAKRETHLQRVLPEFAEPQFVALVRQKILQTFHNTPIGSLLRHGRAPDAVAALFAAQLVTHPDPDGAVSHHALGAALERAAGHADDDLSAAAVAAAAAAAVAAGVLPVVAHPS